MARAICILGMHRSGTSLVAKIVARLGAYFGVEEDHLPANFANPEGYWEHEAIVEVNDAILAALSRRWDTAFPLPEGWPEQPALAEYRGRLAEILERVFAGQEIFAWKDPRTCLTLPLWKKALADVDIPVRYVLVFRNPLDVARSLAVRDEFEIRDSLGLWLHYNLQVVSETLHLDRVTVQYENLLDREGEEVRQLQSALDLRGAGPTASVGRFTDPELCHSRSERADVIRNAPELIGSFYELLTDTLDGVKTWTDLDTRAKELLRSLHNFSVLLHHDLHKSHRCIERLNQEVIRLEELYARLEKYTRHVEGEYKKKKDEVLRLQDKLG